MTKKHGNFGKRKTEETKQKIRESKLKNPTKMFGEDNPATREEVRRKISETVKKRWAEGLYNNRVNGMTGVSGLSHPNVKKLNYHDYATSWHEEKCYICGETEKKIDIHHIDEDCDNFTLTNLVPVCVECHTKIHGKQIKRPFATISKEFKFEAAHQLQNSYSGLCDSLHGHSYQLEVSIRKRLNNQGIVIDFSELKEIVNNYIIKTLDHSYLNDILPNETTAETIAFWIWDILEKDALLKGITKICVKETSSSSVVVTSNDVMSVMKIKGLSKSDRLTSINTKKQEV